ncbi:hypothetical protein [Massilia sp. GCM10023247]|uniref:hypothetical protein n=1 Tax=Massilia sp. GCM10023247 TaxID=3252643 RepID=UPI00360BDE07
MPEPQDEKLAEQEAQREDRGIHVRAIRRGALAILAGIVFALGGSWMLVRALGPAGNTGRPAVIPAPRLQGAPQPERAAYFAEKERRLGSWGWVDRDAGLAHIPLEEAMRLMAAQPGRAAAQGSRR